MRNTEVKMRHPTHNIHSLILNRWSPRSMTAEGITDEDLMGIFEAARWAPSSYNNQPWRFIYAKRVQNIGKYCSTFWLNGTRLGQKMLPY
ncbi:MAG: nitroreductase family protein [Candidatus Nitrosopolaris sp.]